MEELGSVDIQVKPDERAIVQAHRKAGQMSGRAMSDTFRVQMQGLMANAAATVGGARGKGAMNLLMVPGGFGIKAPNATVPGGLVGSVSTPARMGLLAKGRAAVSGVGASAAGALAAIPPVAIAVGAALIGLAVVTKRITKNIKKLIRWSGELSAEAQRLAYISPLLARTQAQRTIQGVGLDINRAQELGPLLAMNEQRKMSIAANMAPLRNIWDQFKAINVHGLLTVIDAVTTVINRVVATVLRVDSVIRSVLANVANAIANLLDALPMGAGAQAAGVLRAIATTLNVIAEREKAILDQMKRMEETDDMTEWNRFATRDIEHLTGGRWRHPVPDPGGGQT